MSSSDKGSPLGCLLFCVLGLGCLLAGIAAPFVLFGWTPIDRESGWTMLSGLLVGPIMIVIGFIVWAVGDGSSNDSSRY